MALRGRVWAFRRNCLWLDRHRNMTRFPTTRWSLVQGAHRESPTGSREQMGKLLECYWLPMYTHLRLKGMSPEKAEDLIQDFMIEILDKRLLSIADPKKGKFRTLLLTALDRFTITQHRRETAAKRSPGYIASLDTMQREEGIACDEAPGQAFDRAWSLDVLAQALARMKRDCEANSKATRWQVFEQRIVAPLLDGATQPAYGDLAKQLGLANEKAAMNQLVTAKRQFARHLRESVREYVTRLNPHTEAAGISVDHAISKTIETATSADTRSSSQIAEHAIRQEVEREIGELRSILARTRSVATFAAEIPRGTTKSDPVKSDFWKRLTHQYSKDQKPVAAMFDLGTADVDREDALDTSFDDAMDIQLRDFSGLKYDNPGTLRELMRDESPSIELLRRVKEWVNICRLGNHAMFPTPLANGLYFLILAAASVNGGQKITGLHDRELKAGYQWLLEQPWLSAEFRSLVELAIDKMEV